MPDQSPPPTDPNSPDAANSEPATDSSTGTLVDLLGPLDDDAKKAVLSEVDKARKQSASYRQKVKELEPVAARAIELENAQKTEAQKFSDQAAAAEIRAQTFRDRAVKAEVRALAAADFADPEDAAAFLDLSHYVDDQGDVDTAAIVADLAALLERKPHLARSGRPSPRPDPSQGSGGNGRPAPASDSDKFVQWWQRTDPRRS